MYSDRHALLIRKISYQVVRSFWWTCLSLKCIIRFKSSTTLVIFDNQQCGSRRRMFNAISTKTFLPTLYWARCICLRCYKIRLKVIHQFSFQPFQVVLPGVFPSEFCCPCPYPSFVLFSPSQPPQMLYPSSGPCKPLGSHISELLLLCYS
jgi:hypothetical protein